MAGAISIIDKNYNLTKFYTILLEYYAVNTHIYHPNVGQFIMRTFVITNLSFTCVSHQQIKKWWEQSVQ